MRLQVLSNDTFWNLLQVAVLIPGYLPAREVVLDSHAIARILGYPEDRLVIQDVTERERRIFSLPTAREARSGQPPPLAPEQILSAHSITSSTSASFYPILITVAREGAFLSESTSATIERFEAGKKAAPGQGQASPFGSFSAGGSTGGGFYAGRVRTPSSVPQMEQPEEHIATISELRFSGQKIDVRVAIFGALEGGTELQKIEGGEGYYAALTPSETEPDTQHASWRRLFEALNVEVHNSLPAGVGVDPGPSAVPPGGKRVSSSILAGEPNPSSGEETALPSGQLGAWFWVAGLAAFIIFIRWVLRRGRGDGGARG